MIKSKLIGCIVAAITGLALIGVTVGVPLALNPKEHVHDWDWANATVTTEPTCTGNGEETAHCKGCDETSTRVIAPLGHVWGGGELFV